MRALPGAGASRLQRLLGQQIRYRRLVNGGSSQQFGVSARRPDQVRVHRQPARGVEPGRHADRGRPPKLAYSIISFQRW